MVSRCCSQCGSNGHNSRKCASAAVVGGGSREIMLFGVRVKVDPMRKSVSMNDLSQYEQPQELSNIDASAAAAGGGYASADDAVTHQSAGSRERKRGVPWTEEEHKLFLLGLQQVGKGDWKGISRNFVKSRTPTQVASHAQKYFIRRNNLNRRRRRSSLFDITTDSVTAISKEDEKVHQNNTIQPVLSSGSLPLPEISNISGFPVSPFPVTIGPATPVLLPVQIENPSENLTLGLGDQVNNASALLVRPSENLTLGLGDQVNYASALLVRPSENLALGLGDQMNNASAQLVRPIPLLPMPNASTKVDLNLSQKLALDPSPLSLKLSLSSEHNQSSSRHSAFQVMSSFNNGDRIITVA